MKIRIVFLLLCLTDQVIQATSLSSKSDKNQTEQVGSEVILSEQEILKLLNDKFAAMQVAADVKAVVIARLLQAKKCDTAVKIDEMLAAVQELALKDGSAVVSRKNFSAVIYEKHDESLLWTVYLLRNKRSTAIHEAGHAVASAYLLQEFNILHEVSLVGFSGANGFIDTLRRCDCNRLYSCSSLTHLYKSYIKMCFCGGIAQQIFCVPDYTKLYDLYNYLDWFQEKRECIDPGLEGFLSNHGCFSDKQSIEELAQILIDEKLTKQTKDEIMKECYYQAYQFMLEHIHDVEKLADLLMQKNVVFGEEVYELFGVQQPLFDFEEPVLPQKNKPTNKKSWKRWKK